jgi:hypothetical protein
MPEETGLDAAQALAICQLREHHRGGLSMLRYVAWAQAPRPVRASRSCRPGPALAQSFDPGRCYRLQRCCAVHRPAGCSVIDRVSRGPGGATLRSNKWVTGVPSFASRSTGQTRNRGTV